MQYVVLHSLHGRPSNCCYVRPRVSLLLVYQNHNFTLICKHSTKQTFMKNMSNPKPTYYHHCTSPFPSRTTDTLATYPVLACTHHLTLPPCTTFTLSLNPSPPVISFPNDLAHPSSIVLPSQRHTLTLTLLACKCSGVTE